MLAISRIHSMFSWSFRDLQMYRVVRNTYRCTQWLVAFQTNVKQINALSSFHFHPTHTHTKKLSPYYSFHTILCALVVTDPVLMCCLVFLRTRGLWHPLHTGKHARYICFLKAHIEMLLAVGSVFMNQCCIFNTVA